MVLTRFDRLDFWLCGGISLIAIILRFPLLFAGLYTDEGGTYLDIATPSVAAMLHHVAIAEFNPPGYFAILWLWTHAVGVSEPMLKLPSLVFGAGMVALAYAFGRLIDSRATAVIAASFATLSITGTILSGAARPYALAGLLASLGVIAFTQIFYSKTPGRWAVAFWLISSALAFVHYSGFILLAGLFIAAVIIAWFDRLWVRFGLFVLSICAVALAYLPAPQILSSSSPLQVRDWLERSQNGAFGSRFLEQIGFTVPFVAMRLQIAAISLAAILAALIFSALRVGRGSKLEGRNPLLFGLTACLLIGTVIEALMFMREQRYMFVFAPLGYTLLAVASRWAWNVVVSESRPLVARFGIGLVSLWLLGGVIVGQIPQYARLYGHAELSGLRAATLAALEHDRDGRCLFFLVPDASAGVFRYYARDTQNVALVAFPYRQSSPSAVHIALAPVNSDNWKIVFGELDALVPSHYDRIATLYAPRSLASPSEAVQVTTLFRRLSESYKESSYNEFAGYQEPAILMIFEPK